MIDPTSPGYATWSQAQRDLAHKCEALRITIANRQSLREQANSPEVRARLVAMTRSALLASLSDRGPRIWREVVSLNKPDLINWLIQDRITLLDDEITRLQKELEDSQPSPYWRPEE